MLWLAGAGTMTFLLGGLLVSELMKGRWLSPEDENHKTCEDDA